ncbi:uncharacterized protein LOC135366923 [Ornithodoros turicata]|uniref:uncharacterized protein LOC135366923 n=1 Tax=Ornithodoros turicata TaxID=34597 RepID=UPI003138A9EC
MTDRSSSDSSSSRKGREGSTTAYRDLYDADVSDEDTPKEPSEPFIEDKRRRKSSGALFVPSRSAPAVKSDEAPRTEEEPKLETIKEGTVDESTVTDGSDEREHLLAPTPRRGAMVSKWNDQNIFQTLRARQASLTSDEVVFSSENRYHKFLAVLAVVTLYILMYVIGGFVYYVLDRNGYTIGYPGYLNNTSTRAPVRSIRDIRRILRG